MVGTGAANEKIFYQVHQKKFADMYIQVFGFLFLQVIVIINHFLINPLVVSDL